MNHLANSDINKFAARIREKQESEHTEQIFEVLFKRSGNGTTVKVWVYIVVQCELASRLLWNIPVLKH